MIHRVAVVAGTRPEAIKMAPLVAALKRTPGFEPIVVTTGQHREMLHQVLETFDLKPDIELDICRPGQDLAALTSRAITGLHDAFGELGLSMVVVQGDTTTTMAGALAAFYRRIPVAHLEAGLRTADISSPFPEEANRRMVTQLAGLHLAATKTNAQRLYREGIPRDRVVVTGNTVVDALFETIRRDAPIVDPELRRLLVAGRRVVAVTAHRRESWGAPLREIASAVREIADRTDVQVVWPVHGNPAVRSTIEDAIADHPRVALIDALGYTDFVHLMVASEIILSDSGGIQEEAPALGKPVIVLREVTERVEAVRCGAAVLAGTARGRIVGAASRLLDADRVKQGIVSPYGDGRAAERAVMAIDYSLGNSSKPQDFQVEDLPTDRLEAGRGVSSVCVDAA